MVKNGSGLHATNEEGFQAYLSGKLGMVCTTIGKRANFEKGAKFKVMASPFPAFGNKPTKIPAGGNFLMVFSKDAESKKLLSSSSNIWNLRKHLLNGAPVPVTCHLVKA